MDNDSSEITTHQHGAVLDGGPPAFASFMVILGEYWFDCNRQGLHIIVREFSGEPSRVLPAYYWIGSGGTSGVRHLAA